MKITKKTKSKIIKASIIIGVILLIGVLIAGLVFWLKDMNRISDKEAREILRELIPKSEKVNELIWGDGIAVAEGEMPISTTITGPQYRRTDPSSGYANTTELYDAIAEVYSTKFINSSIKKTMFDGDDSDPSFMLYPRYKDNDAGELLINIVQEGFDTVGEYHIDPDSARVISVDFSEITLEVDYINTKRTREIVIIKQGDEWRLDTPTY